MNSPQSVSGHRSELSRSANGSGVSAISRLSQGAVAAMVMLLVSGCSTAVAVADAVGSTVVYAGKTVVNTVDAITPDIVNDDDDD